MKAKFNELTHGPVPVLVDFYADWCAPCKVMAPVLEEVKHQFGDKLRVVKIDTEQNQQLAGSLDVRSIPTLILYRNGEAIWRQSGVVRADQLTSIIRQYAP